MSDEYLRFCCSVQALRRRAECLSTMLGGALGVAGDPYPHQLANVRRILLDTHIRHLIADEVGLGKTVQALMIMNALRCQDPTHTTVILAPERLIEQWRQECTTRAHVEPATPEYLGEFEGQPPVLLVRPQELASREVQLAPDTQTLLIVDEPQTMPLEVIGHIALPAVGGRFRQLLLLSATPRLGDPRWRAPIMRLLEPELAAGAQLDGVTLEERLVRREAKALDAAVDLGDPAEARAMFRTSASGRRIIRNGRADWRRYLPQRENAEIRVTPIACETDRFEIARDLLADVVPSARLQTQPWSTVRSLQRSARAAREALATVERTSPQLRERAASVRDRMIDDPGDTRLDALLDVLSGAWCQTPAEKFVIVCGDNPTIVMLRAALPRYFPDLEGLVAVLRRPAAAEIDTIEAIRKMHFSLTPFTSGDAKVLLVGDWIQAGLNLQHTARNIVFYSLPWEAESVDQLIGRIDRIRRSSLRRADQGERIGRVRVWWIVQEGSQDRMVSEALAALRVFERPIAPLSEEDTERVLTQIAKAARGEVAESLRELREIAERSEAVGITSQLSAYDPFTPDAAEATAASWRASRRLPPSPDGEADASPIDISEKAMSHWLRMMAQSGDFEIDGRSDKRDDHIRFSTLWYRSSSQRRGLPIFELPGVGTERWMSNHVVFLSRRRHLRAPPLIRVVTDEGEPNGRLLRFLDHGDAIHDALVEGWITQGSESHRLSAKPRHVAIGVPPGHPCEAVSGVPILLSCAVLDACLPSALPDEWSPDARALLESAVSDRQRNDLRAERRRFVDRCLGVQRWLRDLYPSAVVVNASAWRENAWHPLSEEDTGACLLPMQSGEASGKPRSRELPQPLVSGNALSTESKRHVERIRAAAKSLLEKDEGTKSRIAEQRRCLLAVEQDTVEVRTRELERLRAEKPDASQQEFWQGRVRAQERLVQMAELCRDELLAEFDRLLTDQNRIWPPVAAISLCMRFYVDEQA